MRRLLPVFFCVAASTGLTACDDQPISGPTNDDERALYDFRAAGQGQGAPAFADGDVTLYGRGDLDNEPPIVIIINTAAYDEGGGMIQSLSPDQIASPEGEVLCTKGGNGPFTQLLDVDGTVLFSTMGPWVFEGEPDLSGNAIQQYQSLMGSLRFSYSFDEVVDGLPSSGDTVADASVPVQFSSSWRKLVIASLVDGYCGSDGLAVQ